MKFCELFESGNLEDTNSFTWSYKKNNIPEETNISDDDCGGGGGSLLYQILSLRMYVLICYILNQHSARAFTWQN